VIDDERRQLYAGLWVLKQLDLAPEDGGVELPVVLPHAWAPLDTVLEGLVLAGHVAIDRKRGRYVLTPEGVAWIGTMIDEAEAYIDELDGLETEALVAAIAARRLDPLRVRFLWGWYQGEFDDLVLFQQRRGVASIEQDWASYLLSDAFYGELARDLEAPLNQKSGEVPLAAPLRSSSTAFRRCSSAAGHGAAVERVDALAVVGTLRHAAVTAGGVAGRALAALVVGGALALAAVRVAGQGAAGRVVDAGRHGQRAVAARRVAGRRSGAHGHGVALDVGDLDLLLHEGLAHHELARRGATATRSVTEVDARTGKAVGIRGAGLRGPAGEDLLAQRVVGTVEATGSVDAGQADGVATDGAVAVRGTGVRADVATAAARAVGLGRLASGVGAGATVVIGGAGARATVGSAAAVVVGHGAAHGRVGRVAIGVAIVSAGACGEGKDGKGEQNVMKLLQVGTHFEISK
jgi:hypothetical protein